MNFDKEIIQGSSNSTLVKLDLNRAKENSYSDVFYRKLIKSKVAVLLEGNLLSTFGKTGTGFLRYSSADIRVVIDSTNSGKKLNDVTDIKKKIPIVSSVKDARLAGCEVLVIGLALPGGAVEQVILEPVKQALSLGMSIVNGLHTSLYEKFADQLKNKFNKQWIWDVRNGTKYHHIADGLAANLPFRRILTVGTDMAVGKMSTAIELNNEANRRKIKSQFLATGQTGLMLCGTGIPLDAIPLDFAAGELENLLLQCSKETQIVFIEGQGSIFHPASSAPLSLIRGSQATDMILVHRSNSNSVGFNNKAKLPKLKKAISILENLAAMGCVSGVSKIKGIALNTQGQSMEKAKASMMQISDETGLVCIDPFKFGIKELFDALV